LSDTAGRRSWDWDGFAAELSASLVEVLDEPVTGLTPATHLLDDVGLDSFGILVLLGALEARFDVVLPASDDEPTAGHLFDLVRLSGGADAIVARSNGG
jgi:acyl carrier protein